MVANDSVANAETEACAMSNGFGRVKRIEDSSRLQHSRTVIDYLETDESILGARANHDRATAGILQCIGRVAEYMETHIHKLRWISPNHGQRGFEIDFVIDALHGLHAAKLNHVLHN